MRIFLMAFLLALSVTAFAQDAAKPPEDAARYVCDQQRALSLIREQLAEANKSDNQEARIRLHLTAADLLWLHRRDLAREWFTTAWDASRDFFKQHGKPSEKSGNFAWQGEDLRFVVIKAIARRDQNWAQALLKEMLDEQKQAAEKKGKAAGKDANEAEDVLSLASLAVSLLEVDQAAALRLARQLMTQPSSAYGLTRFLASLAEKDQASADAFCREIILAQTVTHDLLPLSAYVFGAHRPVGPEAQSSWNPVAKNFKPNAPLQRTYVNALLQRAKGLLANPSVQTAASGAYGFSEAAQLMFGLYELDPFANQFLPSLVSSIVETRQSLASLVATEQANNIQGALAERQPKTGVTFASKVKAAEEAKTSAEKDQLLVMVLMEGADTEPESELASVLLKINKQTTRAQMSNWLYFKLTQKYVGQGEYNQATQTAEKVTVLEQRAYLLYEIANALLEKLNDRVRATDSLQAASKAAERAPDSNEKARAYLGIASAYARFDRQMAFDSIRAAVKTINQLKEPNVQSSNIYQTIEGEGFMHMAMNQVKGFDLSSVFQALGRTEFEQALSAANELEEKTLRAAATVALCAVCLSQPPPKPAPAKTAAPVKQT